MQVFVIINKDGMKINVGVNVEKNKVIKKDVIKDLFGILVIVIVNVINQERLYKKDSELVEECSENIDENEMIYNETLKVSLSDYKCIIVHYTLYYLPYF